MARLNLTLDVDTYEALDKHARKLRRPRANVAKEILREGLARRDSLDRRKQIAADYACGRKDARSLLKELERHQLELVGDEGRVSWLRSGTAMSCGSSAIRRSELSRGTSAPVWNVNRSRARPAATSQPC